MEPELTAEERRNLPEHLRYPEAYRYSYDRMEQADVLQDKYAEAREWLRARGLPTLV